MFDDLLQELGLAEQLSSEDVELYQQRAVRMTQYYARQIGQEDAAQFTYWTMGQLGLDFLSAKPTDIQAGWDEFNRSVLNPEEYGLDMGGDGDDGEIRGDVAGSTSIYPGFLEKAGVFRQPARYDENGIPTYLATGYEPDKNGNLPEAAFGGLAGYYEYDDDGQRSPLYRTWRTMAGSEADAYYKERFNTINRSLRLRPREWYTSAENTEQPFANYQPVLTVPILSQNPSLKETRYTRTYSTGTVSEQTRFRNGGKLASGAGQLTKEQMQTLGKEIVGMLVKNYERLINGGHGGEQTGALKQAVEQSDVDVAINGDGKVVINITLADLPGVDRAESGPERSPRPSTGQYGAWVFYGRAGINAAGKEFSKDAAPGGKARPGTQQRTFMRFMLHGKYITSMTVLPSRPFNVFSLTDDEVQQVADRVAEMSGSDLAKAIAETFRAVSQPGQ